MDVDDFKAGKNITDLRHTLCNQKIRFHALKKKIRVVTGIFDYRCPNFEGHFIEGHLAKFASSSACENVSERGEQCHEGLRFEIEFP